MYAKSIRPSAKRDVQKERSAKRDDWIARPRRAQTCERHLIFFHYRSSLRLSCNRDQSWVSWLIRFFFDFDQSDQIKRSSSKPVDNLIWTERTWCQCPDILLSTEKILSEKINWWICDDVTGKWNGIAYY